jgi:hypothetical protein
MIKRIEIDKEYTDVLSELMLGSDFDWYWNPATIFEYKVGAVIDAKTKDTPQFTHTIFDDYSKKSSYYHYFSEMVQHIEPYIGKVKQLIRIKANLIIGDATYPKDFYNGPHADYYGDNILTFLYYVNDSDGDTIFFDSELDGKEHNITKLKEIHRETPKAGIGIVFNSQQIHTSSTPRLTDRRIVINYVFEMENDIKDTQLS